MKRGHPAGDTSGLREHAAEENFAALVAEGTAVKAAVAEVEAGLEETSFAMWTLAATLPNQTHPDAPVRRSQPEPRRVAPATHPRCCGRAHAPTLFFDRSGPNRVRES